MGWLWVWVGGEVRTVANEGQCAGILTPASYSSGNKNMFRRWLVEYPHAYALASLSPFGNCKIVALVCRAVNRRELPPMAATNKSLAQSNKSRTEREATKPYYYQP
jgi:hypothetical protein